MFSTIRGFLEQRGVSLDQTAYAGCASEMLDFHTNAEPEQALTNATESIEAFVDGAEQFDDITMLCLRYDGPQD